MIIMMMTTMVCALTVIMTIPIEVTLVEIVTDVSDVHSEKTLVPNDRVRVKINSKINDERSNSFNIIMMMMIVVIAVSIMTVIEIVMMMMVLMIVTLVGIVTVVSFEHDQKA